MKPVLFILSVIILSQPLLTVAQTDSTAAEVTNAEVIVTEPGAEEIVPVPEITVEAEAGQDRNVAVGRNVLFDASGSTGPSNTPLVYTWDFGDGQQFQSIDASHIYSQPGNYRVKLTVSDGTNTSRDSLRVAVAEDVVVLITDAALSKDTIREYKQHALRNGTLLIVIKPAHESNLEYIVSRSLAEQLLASGDDLSQAKLIMTWTEKNIGLNALSEVGRILASGDGDISTSDISFNQKVLVRIGEKPASSALARLAQTTYNTVQPQYIILTTTAAVSPMLADPEVDRLVDTLSQQNIPYQLIGSHSQRALASINPLNFISYGLNYLVNHGVSPDTIFLLLILPVVATIISFGRQVIGVKAFGIYVPSIITLTFVITDLRFGLLIFVVLLLTATATRIAARRLHLLYLPRMAIVLTIVSFAIFAMFIAAGYLKQPSFLSISIFPILMMIILTEKFVDAQIEQGNTAAIILTVETLALAMISYSIVTWDTFETLILAYPEVVLLTVVINIALGRFSGLRVIEYFRFRKLFKQTKARQ